MNLREGWKLRDKILRKKRCAEAKRKEAEAFAGLVACLDAQFEDGANI